MVLTAGVLNLLSIGSNSSKLSSTAASGGTAPYTQQWYRDTSGSGFTPGIGNIISGATSLTLNDVNLIPSTTYYYKVVYTDAVPNTVISTAFTVTTLAASLNINQFAMAPFLGEMDLKVGPGNVVAAQVDASQITPLYAGQPIKFANNPYGIPTVVAAGTDMPNGYIVYDIKSQNFPAGARCELARTLSCMWLYSTTSITRGTMVTLDPTIASGVQQATGSSTLPVIGEAFDEATAPGQLIRVILNVPSNVIDIATIVSNILEIDSSLTEELLTQHLLKSIVNGVESNSVEVQIPVSSPTNNNLMAMDASGYNKDSGVSVTTDASSNDDSHLPTSKAMQTAISTAVTSGATFQGGWDASGGTFPTVDHLGAPISMGDFWRITVAGTLPGSQTVFPGDQILSLSNVPGQTPSNWSISIGTGVRSFKMRIGPVDPEAGDYDWTMITGAAPSNNPTFTGTVTVPTPVNPTDASTKSYVDTGLATKEPTISNLPVTKGGVGITSYTTGDLLYASASTTLAKLAAVAAGSVLASNGTGAAPVYTNAPAFGGSPTVPNLSAGDSSTKAANTNYVDTGLATKINNTSGSAIQKANGSGGLTAAIPGTDYQPVISSPVLDNFVSMTSGGVVKDSGISLSTSSGSNDNTHVMSSAAVQTALAAIAGSAMDFIGGYDASVNTFPTVGSGTAGAVAKGDVWSITVAGTLGGTAVQPLDTLLALVNAPGQTAANWAINGAVTKAYLDSQIAAATTSAAITAKLLTGLSFTAGQKANNISATDSILSAFNNYAASAPAAYVSNDSSSDVSIGLNEIHTLLLTNGHTATLPLSTSVQPYAIYSVMIYQPTGATTGTVGVQSGDKINGTVNGTVPLSTVTPYVLFRARAAGLGWQTIAASGAVAQGGTGLSSYAVGDLLYASGSTTLSKLADVALGSVVASGGVGAAPVYTNAPAFGGNPTAPDIALGDSSTKLGNTNFTQAAINNIPLKFFQSISTAISFNNLSEIILLVAPSTSTEGLYFFQLKDSSNNQLDVQFTISANQGSSYSQSKITVISVNDSQGVVTATNISNYILFRGYLRTDTPNSYFAVTISMPNTLLYSNPLTMTAWQYSSSYLNENTTITAMITTDISNLITTASANIIFRMKVDYVPVTSSIPQGYVYTPASGTGAIYQNSIAQLTGIITALSPASFTVANIYKLAPTTLRNYLYGTKASNNNVFMYRISATDGTVSAPGSFSIAGPTTPTGICVDPTDRFVYVCGFGAGVFGQYLITKSNGQLSAIASPPTAAAGMQELACHPSGKWLYACNNTTNFVYQYSINQTTGALTVLGTATIACGTGPVRVVCHPSGLYVYVVNNTANTVSMYSVNQTTGQLAALGTPTLATDTGPFGLAISNNGLWAYLGAATGGSVTQYTITNGIIGNPKVSYVLAGARDICVDYSGNYLYVIGNTANVIAAYIISQTAGTLTTNGTTSIGTNCNSIIAI